VELVVYSQENLDIIQHQRMVVMLHNLPAVVEAVMDNLIYMLGLLHPTVVVPVVPELSSSHILHKFKNHFLNCPLCL
jgi:hypothetical protein